MIPVVSVLKRQHNVADVMYEKGFRLIILPANMPTETRGSACTEITPQDDQSTLRNCPTRSEKMEHEDAVNGKEAKMRQKCRTQSVPRRSPIQVLTPLDAA